MEDSSIATRTTTNTSSTTTSTTTSSTLKRKNVKKLNINAKAVFHPQENSSSTCSSPEVSEVDQDEPKIVPVKLSYRKSSKPIGHGRFGTVYSGQILDIFDKIHGDRVTKNFTQKVAVKTLTFKPKVHRELMILEKLNHTNIVRLLMFYKTDKEMYFLFEQMFQTLYDKLDNDGPFEDEDTLWLSLQLFRALDYLRDLWIMHRDIKPTNVLLNETARQLKLCDFGCAKQINDYHQETHLAYMCSRYYRAPELILGFEHYDYSIDVWSAGCVMAEMMIGRPLFCGETSVEQLVDIVSLIGPITYEDLETVQIDKSSPIAQMIVEKNHTSPKALPTFRERLQVQIGKLLEDPFDQIFLNIFKYIPNERWNAERIVSYIEWNF